MSSIPTDTLDFHQPIALQPSDAFLCSATVEAALKPLAPAIVDGWKQQTRIQAGFEAERWLPDAIRTETPPASFTVFFPWFVHESAQTFITFLQFRAFLIDGHQFLFFLVHVITPEEMEAQLGSSPQLNEVFHAVLDLRQTFALVKAVA